MGLRAVRVVSARSAYEPISNDPAEWKRIAFVHEVELFYGGDDEVRPRNIISVGDSLHEQRALMAVCDDVPNCCRKSLKFLSSPTIEQLTEQQELVCGCLLDVAEHN